MLETATDLTFYLAAVPAVILLGISKGGFAGVGMIALPMMALATSPLEAAAIMLPILVVQDAVSLLSYRKTWDGWNLAALLPGAVAGILLGYLLAASVSDAMVALMVGIVSIAFGLRRLFIERGGAGPAVARPKAVFGFLCGVGSGFTSMIAHAGGPPFQMFVLPQRLSRDIFVGTSVAFFAAVNLIKVPPYFLLGQFTRHNLIASATLMPLAIVSTFAGIWLVRRMTADRFYTIIYLLMVAIGIKLSFDGIRALYL